MPRPWPPIPPSSYICILCEGSRLFDHFPSFVAKRCTKGLLLLFWVCFCSISSSSLCECVGKTPRQKTNRTAPKNDLKKETREMTIPFFIHSKRRLVGVLVLLFLIARSLSYCTAPPFLFLSSLSLPFVRLRRDDDRQINVHGFKKMALAPRFLPPSLSSFFYDEG